MTIEQFIRFQATRPFRPYAIHVADGRVLNVAHPEIASLTPSGRTISVLNDDQLIEVVDLLLVTSLRPLPANTDGITQAS